MNTPSWYDVLDVEPTASTDEIRDAWRAGIADLEPGSRRFASLNQAAEVLLDEQKRTAYDAELAEAEGPTDEAASLTPTELDREQARIAKAKRKEAAQAKRATSKQQARERNREEAVAREARSTGQGLFPRGIPTWLLALLGVLAAASVALAVWVWQSGGDADAEASARAAQSAAEQAIVPVLSYDYETLDADRQRAQALMTPSYFTDYDELFGVIADNAPSTETVVTAEVIASGIVRSGEDRVDVLVFVDRPTTNKLTPEPVVYKDQVTVTMQKVGEDWLIDNLVTSPAAP